MSKYSRTVGVVTAVRVETCTRKRVRIMSSTTRYSIIYIGHAVTRY